jgi:type IV pilus assembly protein PilX
MMKKTFLKAMQRSSSAQRGFALFAALLFLIVLTVLAVTVLRSSTVGERIAGNDLDRARAYQAAEATIRDAQLDVMSLRSDGLTNAPPLARPASEIFNEDAGGFTDVPPGCNKGYCFFTWDEYQAATPPRPWKTAIGPLQFAEYGQFTGGKLERLNAQFNTAVGGTAPVARSRTPRYWVEAFRTGGDGPGSSKPRFRITAQAWGVNLNTTVILQEVYAPF